MNFNQNKKYLKTYAINGLFGRILNITFLFEDLLLPIRKNKNPIEREYCKYMPNDTMIEKWVTGKDDVSNADFPMVVDPIHKILYCELPKVGSSNWKRVLIKLTDPRYEDVKNVLGNILPPSDEIKS